MVHRWFVHLPAKYFLNACPFQTLPRDNFSDVSVQQSILRMRLLSSCLPFICPSSHFSQATNIVSQIKRAIVWHAGVHTQLGMICPLMLWLHMDHYPSFGRWQWYVFLRGSWFPSICALVHGTHLRGFSKSSLVPLLALPGFTDAKHYRTSQKIMVLLFCVSTWWHHTAADGEPGSSETGYIMWSLL